MRDKYMPTVLKLCLDVLAIVLISRMILIKSGNMTVNYVMFVIAWILFGYTMFRLVSEIRKDKGKSNE